MIWAAAHINENLFSDISEIIAGLSKDRRVPVTQTLQRVLLIHSNPPNFTQILQILEGMYFFSFGGDWHLMSVY